MAGRRRKRAGTLALWVGGFVVGAIDHTEKFQNVFNLIPDEWQPFLPVVWGGFFITSLLLLNSAHKDDLEELEEKYRQPRLLSIRVDTPVHTDFDKRNRAVGWNGGGWLAVLVDGPVKDVKLRIDHAVPSVEYVRFPIYIPPDNPQDNYHDGDKVYFRIVGKRPGIGESPAYFVGDNEGTAYLMSEQHFIVTAVATGSAPTTEIVCVELGPDYLGVRLVENRAVGHVRYP